MTQDIQRQRHGLFDARVPRYTSYPAANHFSPRSDAADTEQWLKMVPAGQAVSLYIHVPFCRRLCWFCACRTQGISNNNPLERYVDALKTELTMLADRLPANTRLSRLHLGGGTPTILPPELLTDLLNAVFARFEMTQDSEFSVEIDPTEVDDARLDALIAQGLTRASIGVQDFDPKVQESIGRIQSYEQTAHVIDALRKRGVENLNLDVLYGLPFQTPDGLRNTLRKICDLGPDRIALYGYAHVPWMSKRQKLIPEDALPQPPARLTLFETAATMLRHEGYAMIGIDHFAKAHDGLSQALASGQLRRNFQGYTDDQSDVLLGLGASSISRFPQGYAQNQSTTQLYLSAIDRGELATARGHTFTNQDILRGALIEALMCNMRVDAAQIAARIDAAPATILDILHQVHQKFSDVTTFANGALSLRQDARELARIVAHALDTYATPGTAHSMAI